MSEFHLPGVPVSTAVGAQSSRGVLRELQSCDQSEGIAYASAADTTRLESRRPRASGPERSGSTVESSHCRLDQLLRPFLPVCSTLRPQSHQPGAGSMSHAEVQEVPTSTYPCARMATVRRAAGPNALRALAVSRLDDKSRMSREVHVRFCERLGGKFLGPTRPCAETFFHTLKVELTHGVRYETRSQLRHQVFEFIEAYYNTIRRHSTLGYVSPADFEASKVP